MDFFISYSHKDKHFVEKITEIISANNLSFFLDEKDIKFGDNIENSIFQALSNVPNLLVIVSDESLKSLWVPYEIGIVVGKNKYNKIIPVLTKPDIELPVYFKKLKYISNLVEFKNFVTDYSSSIENNKVQKEVKLIMYFWKEDDIVCVLTISSDGARYLYKYKSFGEAETKLKVIELLHKEVEINHKKPSQEIIDYGWMEINDNQLVNKEDFIKWRK